jgi:hypothetical protein
MPLDQQANCGVMEGNGTGASRPSRTRRHRRVGLRGEVVRVGQRSPEVPDGRKQLPTLMSSKSFVSFESVLKDIHGGGWSSYATISGRSRETRPWPPNSFPRKCAFMAAAGGICEVMNDDGTMARVPDLKRFAPRSELKMVSVAQIVEYRLGYGRTVHRAVENNASYPESNGALATARSA